MWFVVMNHTCPVLPIPSPRKASEASLPADSCLPDDEDQDGSLPEHFLFAACLLLVMADLVGMHSSFIPVKTRKENHEV